MSDDVNDTCGVEVEIPTWARKMSIDFRGAPQPEPKLVVPAGAGVFEYRRIPEEQCIWMQERGFTWARFVTTGWHNNPERGRGFVDDNGVMQPMPGMPHLGPSDDPDDKIRYWLDYQFTRKPNFGLHLYDEELWDAETWKWLAYVRKHKPDWLVFTGPLTWGGHIFRSDQYDHVDALFSYQQLTRRTRVPGNYWLHHALAGYYNKPLVFSSNPIESDNPPVLAPADEYAESIKYAAHANGLCVWSADVLWHADQGRITPGNADQLAGILEVLGRVEELQRRAAAEKRPELVVRLAEPGTWPVTFDCKWAQARCRIAAAAGYIPVAGVGEGVDPVEGVLKESPYSAAVHLCWDWDRWSQEREDFMLKYEREVLAPRLREKLGG